MQIDVPNSETGTHSLTTSSSLSIFSVGENLGANLWGPYGKVMWFFGRWKDSRGSLESFEEIGGTCLQIKLVCIGMTCQRTLKVFILIFSLWQWNERIFVRIPWYEKKILWSYVASRGKKVFSRKSFKSFPKEVALKKLLVLCTTMYQDAWIEKTAKVVFKISQNAEVVQISRKVVTFKLFHDEDWFLHSLQSTLIVL